MIINKPKPIKPENLSNLKNKFNDYFNNAIAERTKFESLLKEEHNKKKKEYDKLKKFSHNKIIKRKCYLDKISNFGVSDSDSEDKEKNIKTDCKTHFKLSSNDGFIPTIKQISLDIWSNNDFPIKSNFITPIIDIMSISSPELSKLKYVINDSMPSKSLPLKVGFPLGFSFSAMLYVSSYSMESPIKGLFEIPDTSNKSIKSNTFNTLTDTNSYRYEKVDRRACDQDTEFDRESELGNYF